MNSNARGVRAAVPPASKPPHATLRGRPGNSVAAQTAPTPPSGAPAAAGEMGILHQLVERTIRIVSEEIDCLRSNKLEDLPRLTERKGHALLEIMRHGRTSSGSRLEPAAVAALGRLRSKLELDQRLLKSHISAVAETTRILSRFVEDAEGDGTYTPIVSAAGRPR